MPWFFGNHSSEMGTWNQANGKRPNGEKVNRKKTSCHKEHLPKNLYLPCSSDEQDKYKFLTGKFFEKRNYVLKIINLYVSAVIHSYSQWF